MAAPPQNVSTLNTTVLHTQFELNSCTPHVAGLFHSKKKFLFQQAF